MGDGVMPYFVYSNNYLLEALKTLKETRIRFIHHKDIEDIQIGHNGVLPNVEKRKLVFTGSMSDSCVMEKMEDNVVYTLRFMYINFKRITPSFFNEYASVTRLEIGCPVKIRWTFRNLPYLDHLKAIRFGVRAFEADENTDEGGETTSNFRENLNLRSLELSYDIRYYDPLPDSKKSITNSKIKLVLQLAMTSFPNLTECNMTVPNAVEADLENFVNNFPVLRPNGEKRANYANGSTNFTNLVHKGTKRSSSDHTKINHSNNNNNSTSTANNTSQANLNKRRRGSEGSHSTSSSSSSANPLPRKPPPPPKLSVIVKTPSTPLYESVDDQDDDIVVIEPTSSGIPPDYPERSYNLNDEGKERRVRETSPSLLTSQPPSYSSYSWKR